MDDLGAQGGAAPDMLEWITLEHCTLRCTRCSDTRAVAHSSIALVQILCRVFVETHARCEGEA